MSLLLAFLADLCFGDPEYWYHPVRLMGRSIEQGEIFLRRHILPEKLAGALLAVVFPLLVFGFLWILLFGAGKIHPLLAQLFNILGIYTAISIHDLKKEGQKIFDDLGSKNLEKAKSDLARIVGRDTDHLDEKEIVRAAVETVAESTVDGVIAPLFYTALGGAPLALAYKAVNTLDSMIGHLSERYRDFGFVAAKQDYWVNWLPARLAYGLIGLAAFLTKARTSSAWQTGWKDGVLSGENSSIPEAAFAGALGVRLGGSNSYQGKVVEKSFLGTPDRPLDPPVIRESIRLMVTVSWLTLFLCLLINYGFQIYVSKIG